MTTWINSNAQGTTLTAKRHDKPRWGDAAMFEPEFYLDGESDFNDKGPKGLNATPAGTTVPTIDTSVKKVGSSSMKFEPNGKATTDAITSESVQLSDDKAWSLMFWYKVAASPSSAISLFIRWAPGSWAAGGKAIDLTTGGNITWESHGTPGVPLASSVADDTWRHIALVHDPDDPQFASNEIGVWLNGVQQSNAAVVLTGNVQTDSIEICHNPSGSGQDVHIDEMAYFSYAISDSYISSVYSSAGRLDENGVSVLS